MKTNGSIRQFLADYEAGRFASGDTATQVQAGWFDWFCEDRELVNRLAKLAHLVAQLASSPNLNLDTMYVWFKNNCPGDGELYDDFRFADLATGNVVFTVIPKSGHASEAGRSLVYGSLNGSFDELVNGTWAEVVEWFQRPWKAKTFKDTVRLTSGATITVWSPSRPVKIGEVVAGESHDENGVETAHSGIVGEILESESFEDGAETQKSSRELNQDLMNELCGKVMLFDCQHLTLEPPEMSPEEREFVAKGFANLARESRAAKAEGKIHLFDAAYAEHLAALVRSDFAKGTRW